MNTTDIELTQATGALDVDGNTSQYLTFMLSGEEYGVDILRVQEIKGWDRATPIPGTPDHILGVINLRGTVIPIVDLRRRFDMETAEYGSTTVVVVVRVESQDKDRTMGIVVDAVSDVYNVGDDELKPPPEFGAGVSLEFVRGLATVDDKMVILLDVDRLMNTVDLDRTEPTAVSDDDAGGAE